MKRYVLHFLLLGNVFFALILAISWVTSSGALRNSHWQAPAIQKTEFSTILPTLPAISSVDAGQFLGVLERPIFSATRRPAPPKLAVSAATAPVDNLSTAKVSGIIVGTQGGAIIINIGGKDRRVRLNDIVDGWRLQSVEGRSVTFVGNGQTRVLQLPRAASATYMGAPVQIPEAVPTSPLAPSAPPLRGIDRSRSPGATFGGS